MSNGRDGWGLLAGATRILAPLFGGTEEELRKQRRAIVEDVEKTVDRRRRVLNGGPPVLDVEGETVDEAKGGERR